MPLTVNTYMLHTEVKNMKKIKINMMKKARCVSLQPLIILAVVLLLLVSSMASVPADHSSDDFSTTTDLVQESRYILTVNIEGNGMVVPPSGSSFKPGRSVQVKATASQGWKFKCWGGALLGMQNPATITMDSHKSITAIFEQFFTVVVLPDTQVYSESYPEIFTNQTKWIVENKDELNIVFVVHGGDIVETAYNVSQWDNANYSMSFLEDPIITWLTDGIPYTIIPGNHDDWGQDLYNEYFGVSRFDGREYYKGNFPEGSNKNNYAYFSAGGMDFVVIGLNVWPDADELAWADGVLKENTDRRAIVVTHSLLNKYGVRFLDTIPEPAYDTQIIYESLKNNPNLFMMLCAHKPGEARRMDIYNGHTIYSLLADYQSRPYGGNGSLRLMEFCPSSNKINVKTYSVESGQFESDSDSKFTLTYDMGIDPYIQNVTQSSIVIMWESKSPTTSKIRYRLQGSSSWTELSDASLVEIHEMTITGLMLWKTYDYQVSKDGSWYWTPVKTFRTAPSADNPFRIVVYGDSRTNIEEHEAVVDAIITHNPDIVLHTGDLVGEGRNYTHWEPQFFSPAEEMIVDTPLFPIIGNHEYYGSGPMHYYDLFSLPGNEQWYALTYGSVRIIGLDTNDDENGICRFLPGSDQRNWLIDELKSPEYKAATWKFVFFHHPPYTSGTGHGPDMNVQEYLVPLFEYYGVDMVFNGHVHNYERSLMNGIYYIVSGGGGADLSGFIPNPHPESQVRKMLHHHITLDISPTSGVTFTVWANDGTAFDTLSLPGSTGLLAHTDDGIYKIHGNSQLCRTYWKNDQWNRQIIPHGDVDLIHGSLISGFDDEPNKSIYGVNEYGQVFTTWKNDGGVIKFAIIPGIQDVVPSSLVLGTGMWDGDYKAPGVYGVTTDGNIINFYWRAEEWISRTIPDGKAVPGSLICGDAIYGVDFQGRVCRVMQRKGVLEYCTILSEFDDVIPGSLCRGTGMDDGERSSPGFYGVITSGHVVHYRFLLETSKGSIQEDRWDRRIVPGADSKAVSGSLVPGKTAIFGVSPLGCVCQITQLENGDLTYRHILENYKDVAPGSLCMGDHNYPSDVPGLFGVNTDGIFVNYLENKGSWDRRMPVWGGDVLAGSLVRGHKMYGVDPCGRIVATWHENGDLKYARIKIVNEEQIIEEISIGE